MLSKRMKLLKNIKTRAYQLISKIKIRFVQIKRLTKYFCVAVQSRDYHQSDFVDE